MMPPVAASVPFLNKVAPGRARSAFNERSFLKTSRLKQ